METGTVESAAPAAPAPMETVGEPASIPEEGAPDAVGQQQDDQHLDLARKFNQLTQNEKRFREEQDSFKVERDEAAGVKDRLDNLKADPLKTLEALGISFKDLADMVLNNDEPTTEQKLKTLEEKILAEKEERDADREREEDEWNQAEEAEEYEAAVETRSEAQESIRELIDGGEGKYDLIKSEGAYELVWDVIQEAFDQSDGETVLSFEEAADKTEEYMVKEFERMMSHDKFKNKYRAVEEVDEDAPESLGHNYYQQKLLEEKYGRTLSNEMNSEGASPPSGEKPYMSDEESKHHLAKKLKRMLDHQQA